MEVKCTAPFDKFMFEMVKKVKLNQRKSHSPHPLCEMGWWVIPSIFTVEMGNGWKWLFPQTSIQTSRSSWLCEIPGENIRQTHVALSKSVLFGFVVWMHEQKLQGLPFPENKLDHIILPSASCWPFLPTNHGSEKKVPPSIRLKRHQFLLNHDGRKR